MKVHELIERLRQFPPNAVVVTDANRYGHGDVERIAEPTLIHLRALRSRMEVDGGCYELATTRMKKIITAVLL